MTGPDESGRAFADAMAERELGLFELAERPSSWKPAPEGRVRQVLEAGFARQEPTVLERDDGVRLLYAGRLNALLGEPEGCKSWASLVAVAQELGRGNQAVILDYEDALETAVERLVQLGVPEDAIAGRLVYASPSERFDDVARACLEVAWRTRSGAPTVAVVDSMTEAMAAEGLDPTRGVDVAQFHRGLPRWLASEGAAVVLIDHVTKSREGRDRWAIGSERKISGLDGAAYGFTAREPFGRGVTGRVDIAVSKDRVGFVRQHALNRLMGTLELASDPDTGAVSYRLAAPSLAEMARREERKREARDEAVREAVLAAVRAEPGLNSRALDKAVKGHSADSVREAVAKLVEDGRVRVSTGPNRAKLHYPADECSGAASE